MYHASFRLRERICVHGLPAKPIPVLNVDSTEKLDRHVHRWHVFQPPKRLLKVFCAELPVLSVGRRKLELSDPIRVILVVDQEVNELLRKITQSGQKAELDRLRQPAGCSPRKVFHGKAEIASTPQLVSAIHSCPSLGEFQRYSVRRLGAPPNSAAQTIRHTSPCLLVLLALPIA